MPTVHTGDAEGFRRSQLRVRKPRRRLSADVAVPACYRNRPSAIRSAIYRIWESSSDFGLTRSTTRVLQAIVACGVSTEDPYALIFAKKVTLAKLAECSEVTVYRAMKQLEKLGWIVRDVQERLDDGILDIANIRITKVLSKLIGLDHHSSNDLSDRIDTNVNSKAGLSNREEAPSGVPCKDESASKFGGNPSWQQLNTELKQPSCSHVQAQMKVGLKDGLIYRGEQNVYQKASVNHQSTRRQFVQMDGRSVAQELVWLITENRLTYGQLFKLQGLAKQVPGQELSDFVAYRSQRLKQLETTNDCYRYLKKFIDEGIDARYLCAQRAKQMHRSKRATQRKRVEDVVITWAKAFDGRTLVSAKTGKSYLVHAQSGTIEVIHEGAPANVSMKIDRRFMRAVDSGDLVLNRAFTSAHSIAATPSRIKRSEADILRAETSIAIFKAMLAKSAVKQI